MAPSSIETTTKDTNLTGQSALEEAHQLLEEACDSIDNTEGLFADPEDPDRQALIENADAVRKTFALPG